MATSMATKPRTRRLKSRAVLRLIEAGASAECAGCGQPVKFQAKNRKQQVICNVYVKGRWNRVEHFHEECYLAADRPHGLESKDTTRSA